MNKDNKIAMAILKVKNWNAPNQGILNVLSNHENNWYSIGGLFG